MGVADFHGEKSLFFLFLDRDFTESCLWLVQLAAYPIDSE